MWRRWITTHNFLLVFIDELWKIQKIRILKKWIKNYWRYHHFTHVYQKPQSYEVQFLRYELRQNFLSFWAVFALLTPSPTNNPQNETSEKMKKISGDAIILNLCIKKNTIILCMLTQIWRVCTDIIFCHFRPFFTLFPTIDPEN